MSAVPMKPTKKSPASKAGSMATRPRRACTSISKKFRLRAVELLVPGQKNPTELGMKLGVRPNRISFTSRVAN